jgi:pimeloyl-ACP methyl ester carboxylesterase
MNNIIYTWTQDKLRLQGMHYEVPNKDTCILVVHGMSGNFIENYWGSVLGDCLQSNGYGYIYSHNRGYNHINDIVIDEITKQNAYKSVRMGAVYERFEECLYDIDAWYNEALRLGYKNIVLLGHSLGCNKVIHYIYKKQPKKLNGVILLSPPDMVANGKESGKSIFYENQLSEAKANIREGNPRKFLSDMLWNCYNISSQTFIDMFVDGCPADNLPIMRNPQSFPELEAITVPVMTLMGEFDDIVVRTLQEDMNLLEKKAIHAQSFAKVYLLGAVHTYDNRENELSNEILKWLTNIS